MNSKTAIQIASLARKLGAEDLLDVRNELIRLCREKGIEVLESEACPESDPNCDPPENPKP